MKYLKINFTHSRLLSILCYMNIQEANHYEPQSISMPAWVSPKLNGVRCISIVMDNRVQMFSKSGRAIVSLPHIAQALRALPNGIYDGELLHMSGDWGDTMQHTNAKVAKLGCDAIELHIFDYIGDDWENPQKQASERFSHIANLALDRPLQRIQHTPVTSYGDIDRCYAEYLQLGYEGAMVNWSGAYIRSRGAHMLKIKPHDTCDAIINSIEYGVADAIDDTSRRFHVRVPAQCMLGDVIEISVQGFDMHGFAITPAFVRCRLDKQMI